MWRQLLLIAALGLGAVTLTPRQDACAQKAAKGQKQAQAKPGKEKVREKVRERVRMLRNAKLIEILDLDEATATKLFVVLNKYDDLILPLRAEIGQARRELRQMIDSGKVDDKRANQLIDVMIDGRAQIEKLERERTAEVRKILPPAQVAKVIVYLPEIERAIEAELRKYIKKNRPDFDEAGDGAP